MGSWRSLKCLPITHVSDFSDFDFHSFRSLMVNYTLEINLIKLNTIRVVDCHRELNYVTNPNLPNRGVSLVNRNPPRKQKLTCAARCLSAETRRTSTFYAMHPTTAGADGEGKPMVEPTSCTFTPLPSWAAELAHPACVLSAGSDPTRSESKTHKPD